MVIGVIVGQESVGNGGNFVYLNQATDLAAKLHHDNAT